MVITSNSQRLTEIVKNQVYDLRYGVIKKGANTKVEINISDVEHLTVKKSCGCTAPSIEITPTGIKLTIVYDSNKVGTINQNVTETVLLQDGTQQAIIFNLKGQIV